MRCVICLGLAWLCYPMLDDAIYPSDPSDLMYPFAACACAPSSTYASFTLRRLNSEINFAGVARGESFFRLSSGSFVPLELRSLMPDVPDEKNSYRGSQARVADNFLSKGAPRLHCSSPRRTTLRLSAAETMKIPRCWEGAQADYDDAA